MLGENESRPVAKATAITTAFWIRGLRMLLFENIRIQTSEAIHINEMMRSRAWVCIGDFARRLLHVPYLASANKTLQCYGIAETALQSQRQSSANPMLVLRR